MRRNQMFFSIFVIKPIVHVRARLMAQLFPYMQFWCTVAAPFTATESPLFVFTIYMSTKTAPIFAGRLHGKTGLKMKLMTKMYTYIYLLGIHNTSVLNDNSLLYTLPQINVKWCFVLNRVKHSNNLFVDMNHIVILIYLYTIQPKSILLWEK